LARVELALTAFVGFVVAPLWFVVAPQFTGGMMQPPWWQTEAVIQGVGAAIFVTGFIWMVRIYRADPEPDQRAWRYRERGD